MLDDLRSSSAFIEDEEEEETSLEANTSMRQPRARRQSPGTFLGMTAMQRFIISLMLFMMVFIVGVLALMATGSIYLPF